jgi:pimeloyl-ACP methyl ester carboxylesterase
MTEHAIRRTPEAFVSANGLTLCYDTFGDPADPALLLIMGMGAQMIGWEDGFCEALASRRFFVVRFDNRDAGRSTRFDHAGTPDIAIALTRAWLRKAVDAPYLLEDMALDTVGLLDALNIRRAHVVGASMGATIGQTLAIRFPERLLTLTSIMSTTGAPDLPPPHSWALAAIFRPAPRALDAYIEYYVRTWRLLRGTSFPEDEALDRARGARNHARGLNPAGGARQLAAILASGSRRQALRGVTVPTLVIHGDRDPLVPLAAGLDTAKSVPGAEMIVVEGMGHGIPMRAWTRIVDSIARHAARGGGR